MGFRFHGGVPPLSMGRHPANMPSPMTPWAASGGHRTEHMQGTDATCVVCRRRAWPRRRFRGGSGREGAASRCHPARRSGDRERSERCEQGRGFFRIVRFFCVVAVEALVGSPAIVGAPPLLPRQLAPGSLWVDDGLGGVGGPSRPVGPLRATTSASSWVGICSVGVWAPGLGAECEHAAVDAEIMDATPGGRLPTHTTGLPTKPRLTGPPEGVSLPRRAGGSPRGVADRAVLGRNDAVLALHATTPIASDCSPRATISTR